MIRSEVREKFPLTIWIVRLSIYDGRINCLVRDEIARVRGSDYITADGKAIKQSSIMQVSVKHDDPEFERSIICDDESKVNDCVQILRESLREATAKRVRDAQAIDAIARQETVTMKWRNFVD